MGVEGGAARCLETFLTQQLEQLEAAFVPVHSALVEHLGHGSPGPVAGHGGLLLTGSRLPALAQLHQGAQRGHVRLVPGDGAGGCQVVLARGAEGFSV